jgi:predicted transposase YdaD
VREDGRIVGREEGQEKVHNRQERKKLLRMARNCHILHMPMERMNKFMQLLKKTYHNRDNKAT